MLISGSKLAGRLPLENLRLTDDRHGASQAG
jgi:hypothetical protein